MEAMETLGFKHVDDGLDQVRILITLPQELFYWILILLGIILLTNLIDIPIRIYKWYLKRKLNNK